MATITKSHRLAVALAGLRERLEVARGELYPTIEALNERTADLASARAELGEARRENRAWRALALRSAATSLKILFDAEITPSLEAYFVAYMERGAGQLLDMGEGKTVEAAAVDLATKLNLLTTEAGAKEGSETDG